MYEKIRKHSKAQYVVTVNFNDGASLTFACDGGETPGEIVSNLLGTVTGITSVWITTGCELGTTGEVGN